MSDDPRTATDETTEAVVEAPAPPQASEPLATESLVEEVSIDGMCGVY